MTRSKLTLFPNFDQYNYYCHQFINHRHHINHHHHHHNCHQVNDDKKYVDFGYIPCNGHVPCQPAHLSPENVRIHDIINILFTRPVYKNTFQVKWPQPDKGNFAPCILPCKIGGSQNIMKERYLSKTPFLTFVYLSKCNTKLPGIFGNSKKMFL